MFQKILQFFNRLFWQNQRFVHKINWVIPLLTQSSFLKELREFPIPLFRQRNVPQFQIRFLEMFRGRIFRFWCIMK